MTLFIAAGVPDAEKEHLGAYATEVKTVASECRLVPPRNWHLTMAFLGQDVSDDAVGRAKAALEGFSAEDFLFDVRGISYFPTEKPDQCIVWAHVEDVRELRHCHRALAEALGEAGFTLRRQEFRPHVTLARNVTRLHAAELTKFELYAPAYPSTARELKLLRTVHPAGGGVVYEELASCALGAPKSR